jgi:hypothetical protein
MRDGILVGSMVFFLLAMMYLFPVPAEGRGIVITDDPGDVMRTGYVDMEIGGNSKIDIVSLSSTETIVDVTVVLECVEDITDEVGYLYTITVSDIHISYQDGIFEVWRLGTDVQPVDNVQTGVAGKEMTAVLKKTTVGSELIINATTQFYALDWTKGATTESYYDLVGDFENGQGSAVGDYTQTYNDDNGDVRVIFLDEQPSDEDGMDIISISIDQRMDIELQLELEDAPIIDGSAEYTIFIGKSEVIWSEGEGRFYPEDEGSLDIDSSYEDNLITITLPGEYFDESVGGVIVRSRWDIDENTFIQDLLPDDPHLISELLPFPAGLSRKMKIEIRSPENVIMKRIYSHFPSQAREDIRSSIDINDDGDVDDSELEEFLDRLESDVLSSDHDGDLTLDKKAGEMELSIEHSGLIGPVGSGSEIEIVFLMEFTYQTADVWDLRYDIEIEFFQPGITGSLRLEDREIQYIVLIEVRGGWEIDPIALEPAELSNFLSSNGTFIEYELTGESARDFDPGSISIGIRVKDQIDDDDETGDEEDLTWLYVIILIIMLIIVAGLLLWYRQED